MMQNRNETSSAKVQSRIKKGFRNDATLHRMRTKSERVVADRLDEASRRSGYSSDEDLAKAIGVSKSQISRWRSGDTAPTGTNLYALCEVLGVSSGYLFGREERDHDERESTLRKVESLFGASARQLLEMVPTRRQRRLVPLFRIAAGRGRSVLEHPEGEIEVPVGVGPMELDGCYALRIEGESMSADDLHNGDIVLVKSTPIYTSADMHVVWIKSRNEVTLKRVRKSKGVVTLKPSNPEQSPFALPVDDVEPQAFFLVKLRP